MLQSIQTPAGAINKGAKLRLKVKHDEVWLESDTSATSLGIQEIRSTRSEEKPRLLAVLHVKNKQSNKPESPALMEYACGALEHLSQTMSEVITVCRAITSHLCSNCIHTLSFNRQRIPVSAAFHTIKHGSSEALASIPMEAYFLRIVRYKHEKKVRAVR